MVYLHGLTYVLGRACKTSELSLDRRSAIELLAKGADGYRKAELGLIDAAVTVARECLKRSSVSPEGIDMVLFGSNSLNAPDAANDIGHSLVSILGLKRAHAQLVGFQNCGDSVPILRTAQAMVRSGLAKNVLVVMADDTDAAALPRVVGANAYLHSDGASACLVSARPGQFELVDSAVRHIDAETGSGFDPMDMETHLHALLLEARALLTAGGAFDPADARSLVITHNMNRLFGVRVSQAIGVSADSVFAQPGLGHCMASDALINLATVAHLKRLAPGSVCAVVVPTRRSVGVLTLRWVESSRAATDHQEVPLESHYAQGVRESMSVLPHWMQPMLSSLTGKPLKGEAAQVLDPKTSLMLACVWLLLCLGVPALMLSTPLTNGWAWATAFGLPLCWLGAAGQMRKLQVVVGHHCVHRVFLRGAPRLNDGLLECVSTLILVQSAREYRRDHLGHHSRTLFTTREDADAAFLLSLGFRPGLPVSAAWRLLGTTLISPRFHLLFLSARLRSALGPQRAMAWRAATSLWMVVLLVALPALIGTVPSLLAIWIPLIGVYQGSALLQFLTEHAWLRSEQPPQGKVDYAQRCWGRFLGERCPEPGLPPLKQLFAWSRWWTRMALVHAPVRMSCLVGDLPAHDWHHLCGFLGGDPARWTCALHDRQNAIDAVTAHPLARQMGRQELWGLSSMLDHVFHLLATAPRSDQTPPPVWMDTGADDGSMETSAVPLPHHHEESELHPTP